MIIRSQHKRNITNFNQITDIQVRKNNDKYDIQVYYPFSVDDEYAQMHLGEYSTEEKAIKVLDMICEHAEALHFSKVAPKECGQIWGNVFNMPQDSEV